MDVYGKKIFKLQYFKLDQDQSGAQHHCRIIVLSYTVIYFISFFLVESRGQMTPWDLLFKNCIFQFFHLSFNVLIVCWFIKVGPESSCLLRDWSKYFCKMPAVSKFSKTPITAVNPSSRNVVLNYR